MALFDYKCLDCGHTQEKLIRNQNVPTNVRCEKCQGKSTKQMSAAVAHFKGAGFYINDYGKNSERLSSEKDLRKMHDKITTTDTSKENSAFLKSDYKKADLSSF